MKFEDVLIKVQEGLLIAITGIGIPYLLERETNRLTLSDTIKQKENYLEVIQGKDTLRFYQHNDSTYNVTPKEIFEAKYKADSLRNSYQLKADSIENELKTKLNKLENELE